MDKCREEFEIWLNEYAGSEIDFSAYRGKTPSGEDGYLLKTEDATSLVTSSWQAWKASRESMNAIKLPKKYVPIGAYKPDYDVGFDNSIDMCKEAITSAGYEVEE